MLNPDLRGVVAATTTPVNDSLDIDVQRLAHHIERLFADGCSFVSTFGTTGEGASLSTTQKAAALEKLRAEGIRMAGLIPAIMTPAVDEAAGFIAASHRSGCRGVLVLPPFYYNDPNREGVVAFIDEALRRAGRPKIDVLLYNIPRFTGVSYDVELICRLVEVFGSAIVGVKDSTGDAANSLSLVNHFPDISIFTGDDRVMPGLVAAGGAGIIGGLPNLFAADLRRIYEDPTGQATAHLRENQARRIAAIASRGDLTAVKATLATLYNDPEWTRPLPPLRALSPAQTDALLLALAETGYVPQGNR